MATNESKKRSFFSRLNELPFWISVIGLFVSVSTFYLVNLRAGAINLHLPDEIALKITKEGRLTGILVPTTFHYTGAPNKQQVVNRIQAKVIMVPLSQPANEEAPYQWKTTLRFVGRLEFERLYPEKKEEEVDDYVVYDGRNMPFGLRGGDVFLKVLGLEPSSDAGLLARAGNLELVLQVSTAGHKLPQSRASYRIAAGDVDYARAKGTLIWSPRTKDD